MKTSSDIVLCRSLARIELERICSKQTQINATEETFKNTKDDYSTMIDSAKIVKDEVSDSENWMFFWQFRKKFYSEEFHFIYTLDINWSKRNQ